MKLSEFHYDLPASSIAQEPIEPRDHSRLLVLDREAKTFQHKRFYELVHILRPNDVLVLNATRVFPARLRGRKKTGGKIDVLLLESRSSDGAVWRALVRGATLPTTLIFQEDLSARMEERLTEGEWLLRFSQEHIRSYLERHGEMPLPPYIKRPASRKADLDQYQTVYAEKEGAVAAPTAGFHFTSPLLQKIRNKGISILSILLHVGWGTFRPIRTDHVEKHRMLPEAYDVSETVAYELNLARRQGRRIIAVGTTAVRTLETICDPQGIFHAGQGRADLFIYPGYRFKAVEALITNFHLPDATPLFLACAFYEFDPENSFTLKAAYTEAIKEGYRFYSYGDAMFIQ
jgi:S-adenosylmethionine:tRNA ribosyltransferase-isomerase